jgi:hypothetical protein
MTIYPHDSIYKSEDKIFTDELLTEDIYITVWQVGWDDLVRTLEQGKATQPRALNSKTRMTQVKLGEQVYIV